ncbi:MAG: hypothetical protein ABIJ65_04020 [Chloroflexota bacterium]
MVLSENNEPFMKGDPTGSTPNPGEEETPDSPTSEPNPGERLRSIEMASTVNERKKINLDFLKSFKKVKISKEDLLLTYRKFSSTISIIFNIILLVVVLILSQQVFSLKRMVVKDVLGSMYLNIGELDLANISTEIALKDDLQLDFPLRINKETDLVLTADTVINGATISISTGSLNITSAPATIVLPAGAHLPVQMNMSVPVNASVPVDLNVPVNIPMEETGFHQSLANMQKVIQPILISFMDGPTTSQEVPACKLFGFVCNWWFK